jgi:hypothetical protein
MRSRPARLMITAFAAGLALLSIAADAQEWRRRTFADDGFSAEFFGEVKVEPTGVEPATKERIIRSTNYLQDEGAAAYLVGASLARYSIDFDKGVNASFDALKCKTKFSDIVLNVAVGQAREISATECTDDGSFAVEARYVQAGRWFYQVLAIYEKGQDKARARHFITSFATIDGAKE